jgi:hypothetical protein
MIIDKNLYNGLLHNYKDFILSFYVLNTLAIFVEVLVFFLIYNVFNNIDIILYIIIFSFTISIYLLTLFLNIYIVLTPSNVSTTFNITYNLIYLNYILRIIKFGIFKNLFVMVYSIIHLYKNESQSLKAFSLIGIFISCWLGLFSYMYTKVIKELILSLSSCIELEKVYFNNIFELTDISINNINDIDNCSICLNEMNNQKYEEIDKEKTEKLLKDKIVILKKCNHPFHKECITKWLSIKNTCPNCRENII